MGYNRGLLQRKCSAASLFYVREGDFIDNGRVVFRMVKGPDRLISLNQQVFDFACHGGGDPVDRCALPGKDNDPVETVSCLKNIRLGIA